MLKVGVVGVGGISGAHIPAWEEIKEVELVALCDIRQERLDNYPAKRHYNDFKEMLEKEELDILDICLPTYLHADYAIMAMEKGINVICEKPISLKEEDIERVYSTAKKNNVKFMIAQVLRFWPEYELLKEIFGEKRLKISTDDGWSDYLYNASDLITYSGKKFNGQRTHVNRFNRLYPDAVFEPLTRENFDEAYEFLKNYISQNGTTSESGELEGCAAIRLMKRYFYLNLYGAILKANNKIISLSIGEKVGDTLFVHVEKGLIEFSGVYQVMVQKFAEAYAGDVLFINREEDDGVDLAAFASSDKSEFFSGCCLN